jgi:hypothetical protein
MLGNKELRTTIDLYQLQMEGLKKGWLIYPKTLNPLSLTIKKKKQKPNPWWLCNLEKNY